jgi:thiol:disulfide interchange protein DsbD
VRVLQGDGALHFTEPKVHEALGNSLLLQADVTANDEQDRELLQHFGIFGPPTIAFYSVEGVEQRDLRVVGFKDAESFARQTQLALSGRCTRPT